jgi:hypothetical protein
MGRYEVLLQKNPEEEVSYGGEGVVVSKEESPTEFLEKLFKEGKLLTKFEINESLADYYGKYAARDGLHFEICIDEEGEGIEISPSNDYTSEVMQRVRNVFKNKRA